MADPSEYELAAWRAIQQFKGRPLSRAMRGAGEQLAVGVGKVGARVTKSLENHPGAQSVVLRGQEIAAGSAKAIGAGARKTVAALPDVAQLGVERSVARLRPSILTMDQVEVVNEWLGGCELGWIECGDVHQAHALEVALRGEWLPTLNIR